MARGALLCPGVGPFADLISLYSRVPPGSATPVVGFELKLEGMSSSCCVSLRNGFVRGIGTAVDD